MKKTIKLPDTPSQLLKLALTDLKKCERSKKFKINMNDYWYYQNKNTCFVCLAGAVMVKSLNIPTTYEGNITPFSLMFDENIRRKLRAINSFRCGDIVMAYSHFNRKMPDILPKEFLIRDYYLNTREFKKDIQFLISELKKIGE